MPTIFRALSDLNNAHEDGKKEKSEVLMNTLNVKRRKRWEETVSRLDFTHSSRKAWSTINQLTGRSRKPKPCPVSADSIASVIVNNGKWTDKSKEAKAHSHYVNAEIKKSLVASSTTSLSYNISRKELCNAILCLQNSKAPGVDQIPPEFLKHTGLRAIDWLCAFLSDCLLKTMIQAIWRQAKVAPSSSRVSLLISPRATDQSPCCVCPTNSWKG